MFLFYQSSAYENYKYEKNKLSDFGHILFIGRGQPLLQPTIVLSYNSALPPYPVVLNIMAGFFEILFALLLISPKTRRFAVYGIILMLLAFLPVHVQMVIDAPFLLGTLTISPLVA
jgi:hypothetical membrane protein